MPVRPVLNNTFFATFTDRKSVGRKNVYSTAKFLLYLFYDREISIIKEDLANFKEITKEIFTVIAEIPRVFVVSFSRKSLLQKECLIEVGYNPWQISHTLKRFERSRYLQRDGDDLRLTQKGVSRMIYYKVDDINFAAGRNWRWDKKWRIIIFDIPERTRSARDIFRDKLCEWNCYKIQNSVFVTPYNCENELNQLIRTLNINNCVHILLTADLRLLNSKLLKHYKLG